MENDRDMRRFLKQLLPFFYNPDTAYPEMADSFFPVYLPAKEKDEVKRFLFMKRLMISEVWQKFISISCVKMIIVSSHEMFARYVMFACRFSITQIDDVFDRFLTVCSLVIEICVTTYSYTGVDYYALSIDIVMIIYKFYLKKPFRKNGGISKLIKYIVDNKDLAKDLEWSHDFSFQTTVSPQLFTKILKCCEYFPENFTHPVITSDFVSHTLAQKLLNSTKVSLPALPSSDELKARLRSAKQWKDALASESNTRGEARKPRTMSETLEEKRGIGENENLEALDAALQQSPISNSDSTIGNVVENERNIEWYDNVIQAVIEHNSKGTDLKTPLNPIQKEAFEVLRHLQSTIGSLIQILDKYDKE